MDLMDLIAKEDLSIEQKIVEELLNNNNLDTKTELEKPLIWAISNVIENFLESKSLLKSKNVLNKFTQIAFRYLISKNRKGRLEYLEALKGLKDRIEHSTLDMGLQKNGV